MYRASNHRALMQSDTMTRQFLLTSLLLAVLTFPARADAIDGNWCAQDGRSLTIDGPKIRIPSGAQITGEYTRHLFRYVGPVADPEAGHDVRMRIRSDDDMRLERIIDGVTQPEEQWRRCKPIA